ncbi:mitochondrial ribosome-associated GTPase 2 isoform X1 [Anthonomus grandis grandis]|uniref:mitochondrial ribosome-associated GTPase 2 isoform X1 n=1 Tax=Anthonomus grandis grandis TaxID=2921223 RepID=UPI002165DC4F|nr:mitochondrial ribosome-associated GTPase 2 isoform X1 [Anthonomus grandis grandis]
MTIEQFPQECHRVSLCPQNNSRQFRAIGGKGGDGCISFLQLWCNEHAGPDGGDGGHGGHVILKATSDVRDLGKMPTLAEAEDGEKGSNKDCNGKNASHMIIDVPIGTVIKDNNHKVVGDLKKEGLMFIAARGGAGGKGNHFFASDIEQTPKICEFGALGEDLEYTVEIKSMAHVGLIGFPNAGKSTLLRAISRARPKVAPYPFTTLKPYLGIVEYDDYEQVAVADLPGLIPDSHKNKGLGIQFLRHAERCMALVFVLDASLDEPWNYLEILQYELSQFDERLRQRPHLLVANKIDLPEALANIEKIREETGMKVIGVSGKTGENVEELLKEIKIIYDKNRELEEKENYES